MSVDDDSTPEEIRAAAEKRIESVKKAVLQSACRKLKLPDEGKKDALLVRLQERLDNADTTLKPRLVVKHTTEDAFDGMTQTELREACKSAGLPAGGSNKVLADRLRMHNAAAGSGKSLLRPARVRPAPDDTPHPDWSTSGAGSMPSRPPTKPRAGAGGETEGIALAAPGRKPVVDDDGSDDERVTTKFLKNRAYNSAGAQEATWRSHKQVDAYTAWTCTDFSVGKLPVEVDHILELQVVADAVEEALAPSRATRGVSRRVMAGKLRDTVLNEPQLNLNITCEKVNKFKGSVFKQRLRSDKHTDFREAVDACNEEFSKCKDGPFFASPVVATLIDRSGSRADVIAEIVGNVQDETKAAYGRVKAVVEARTGTMADLSIVERGMVNKVLDTLAGRLEAWGLM
jgi:hypothetical protein